MKKKITFKITISVICISIVLSVLALTALGVFMGYGPLHSARNLITASYDGNADEYSFDKIEKISGTILENKNVCVLGSSVVYGYASQEKSIAEYLTKRFGCNCTKEAISGTTLVDTSSISYISRMKNLDKNAHYDLFICQLSTNDATKKKPLGEISNTDEYDTNTVTGALEYIINYVERTWDCPVVFFTGSRYDSEEYDAMVNRLLELKEKYAIGVIDLWTDEEFNSISDEQRKIYMSDNVHPTKAGYRDWWGPEFEHQLIDYLKT